MLDRLDRLRHDAVVGRNDQDNDVRRFRSAGTHHGERFVARRVQENHAAVVVRIVGIGNQNAVCTDVLRDAAGFAFGDICRADRVEQRCLTVIDVAHDGDDRGTRHLDVVGIRRDKLFELLLDDHFLERHES